MNDENIWQFPYLELFCRGLMLLTDGAVPHIVISEGLLLLKFLETVLKGDVLLQLAFFGSCTFLFSGDNLWILVYFILLPECVLSIPVRTKEIRHAIRLPFADYDV